MTKLTDEALTQVREMVDVRGYAAPPYDAMASLLAHIAALTKERDAAREVEDALLSAIRERMPDGWSWTDCPAEALYVLANELEQERSWRDEFQMRAAEVEAERDALRERVRALEELAAAAELANEAAESRIAAIRQRAGDRDGLRRMAEVCAIMGSTSSEWDDAVHADVVMRGQESMLYDVADGLARYILGADAPAPEAHAPQTDDLAAVEQWRENQEAKAEPSTAGAFATVRDGVLHEGGCMEAVGLRCDCGRPVRLERLSLLERRVGAQDAVMRRLIRDAERPDSLPETTDEHGERMVRVHWTLVEELRAALTDAPDVFTLNEVDEAMTQDEHDPRDIKRVLSILLSLRRK